MVGRRICLQRKVWWYFFSDDPLGFHGTNPRPSGGQCELDVRGYTPFSKVYKKPGLCEESFDTQPSLNGHGGMYRGRGAVPFLFLAFSEERRKHETHGSGRHTDGVDPW